MKKLYLESYNRCCQDKIEINCRYLCENFIMKSAYVTRENTRSKIGLRLMMIHMIAAELRLKSQFSSN